MMLSVVFVSREVNANHDLSVRDLSAENGKEPLSSESPSDCLNRDNHHSIKHRWTKIKGNNETRISCTFISQCNVDKWDNFSLGARIFTQRDSWTFSIQHSDW